MTATLRQVAAGLAARLDTIPGLRTYDHIPGNPQLPAAIVEPPAVTYEGLALSGEDALPWLVVVLVATQQDRKQLDLLDYQDVTGPRSIPAAIQADRTLGLTGIDAFVNASRPMGLEEIAGYGAWGGVFDVMVLIT